MNGWFDRLRFLWEEEAPPPGEAARAARGEPTGVPRAVRAVTRFLLTGTVAVGLMTQIIGIRLVAPVDAQPSYQGQCNQFCANQFSACARNRSEAHKQCDRDAKAEFEACKDVCRGQRSTTGSVAFNDCMRTCEHTYVSQRSECAAEARATFKECQAQQEACKEACKSGP